MTAGVAAPALRVRGASQGPRAGDRYQTGEPLLVGLAICHAKCAELSLSLVSRFRCNLFYSMLSSSDLFHSTGLFSVLLCSMLKYSVVSYSILVQSGLVFFSFLFFSFVLYSTLLYSTLPYPGFSCTS